jgi:hypothetical protein
MMDDLLNIDNWINGDGKAMIARIAKEVEDMTAEIRKATKPRDVYGK